MSRFCLFPLTDRRIDESSILIYLEVKKWDVDIYLTTYRNHSVLFVSTRAHPDLATKTITTMKTHFAVYQFIVSLRHAHFLLIPICELKCTWTYNQLVYCTLHRAITSLHRAQCTYLFPHFGERKIGNFFCFFWRCCCCCSQYQTKSRVSTLCRMLFSCYGHFCCCICTGICQSMIIIIIINASKSESELCSVFMCRQL